MKPTLALPGGILLDSDLAVYVRSEDTLAIADMHLGYEAALQAEHVAIPRFQLDRMLERLERLLARYRPRRLVINGDMKHEFGRNRPQEWDEVEAVLDLAGSAGAEVVVVRGNHDNYLKTMLARRGIPLVEHFSMPESRMIFLHGHRPAPVDSGYRVFGHEHPVLRLRDEVGAQITLPCFLHDRHSQLLVMPAFSPLASGTNVISPGGSFMSPDLRKADLAGARVMVVQGGITDMGTVADLRRLRDDIGGGRVHDWLEREGRYASQDR